MMACSMRYSKRVGSDSIFDKKLSLLEGCMNTNNCSFGGFASFGSFGMAIHANQGQAGMMPEEAGRMSGDSPASVATMPSLC